MAQEPELQADTEWYGDDMEMEMEMDADMSDDDFEFDDALDIEDGDDTVLEEEVVKEGNVPVWRLIEMSRENRFLRAELADFDDYDVDGYGTEYAH
jgi:hypothetical protein